MSDCQQIMTVTIKNRGDPHATSLPRGGTWKARINCLSVVIWMQHLAVIYVKAEKALWENIFQVQQLAAIYIIWGENRWNKYLTGLHNEMDIFIHSELSQRLCNECRASAKDLSAFVVNILLMLQGLQMKVIRAIIFPAGWEIQR